MSKKEEFQLTRADLVDGVRTMVGYELRKQKRRVLNEIEQDALARFDAAVMNGEDFQFVVEDVLSGGITIRGELA